MVKIAESDYPKVAKAVVMWTGYDSSMFPYRNSNALADFFSPEESLRLMSIVRFLEEDFYKSNAHKTSPNASKMKSDSIADFKAKHPDLPSEIADAFAWCYTFDFR